MTYLIIGQMENGAIKLHDDPRVDAKLLAGDIIQQGNEYARAYNDGTKLRLWYCTAEVLEAWVQPHPHLPKPIGVITTYDFAEDYYRGMG